MKKFSTILSILLSCVFLLASCTPYSIQKPPQSANAASSPIGEPVRIASPSGRGGAAGAGEGCTSNNIQKPPFSTLEVHYIDVGQADSSLILCDSHSMLIDGGNVADSNLIAAYLKKLNVTSLDYLICTHAHEDHVGGLSGALSVVSVQNILAPETEANTKAYQNFKNKSAAQGLKIQHPAAGDSFALGCSIIQIVGPITEHSDDLNNTSLVIKLTYGNTSFLFTGDAEREEEQEIIKSGFDLTADVLKVGHHGSESSTSYIFLREVMPQYAVISAGKNNAYGHPAEAVLSRLRDADVQIYRTDLQGDIIAVSDGNNITITTEKNGNIQE